MSDQVSPTAKRDGYVPGVPCWVDTSQPDPQAAAEFYGALFGWQMESVVPDGVPGEYIVGRLHGLDVAAVGSIPEGAPASAMWNTYIWVDSADETAAKAVEAGGAVLTEPFDVLDSGRMAVLGDPEGAVFCAWQPNEHRGAQLVNDPGSLSFNTLNCRDPEGAKAFYNQLFGWEVLDLGSEGSQMWTLRSYGDHLEEQFPGLRESVNGMGAPAGFENVVASLARIPGDQTDVAAHWDVTFAVADADATAAKAVELGGNVIAEPFDAPWVRMTVITDPQGATFTASKFVPENRNLGAADTVAGTA